MRQAIDEGFILDVLQNYTTYDTYYRLVKLAEDDPDFPRAEQPALQRDPVSSPKAHWLRHGECLGLPDIGEPRRGYRSVTGRGMGAAVRPGLPARATGRYEHERSPERDPPSHPAERYGGHPHGGFRRPWPGSRPPGIQARGASASDGRLGTA